MPLPPRVVTGRRFSVAFAIAPSDHGGGDSLVCRRCGAVVCDVEENLYDHLVVRSSPTAGLAPLGLEYEGSEEFVVTTCYCPGCGRQVDVVVGRADEPILRASEPLGTQG